MAEPTPGGVPAAADAARAEDPDGVTARAERRRLKGLFFWYFGYVGILSPYLSLYLVDRGFDVTQIGVLLAVPQVLRIVSPQLWGWLADRGGRQVTWLRLSGMLSLAAILSLSWASAAGFWPLVGLMVVLSLASGAQVPIGEARTLAVTRGEAGAYGRIRLWGSVGFILGVLGIGPVLDRIGLVTLPIWLALALAGLLVVVWRMHEAPAPGAGAAATKPVWPMLAQAHVGTFFAANFLMIFAHAALYVLYSLLLADFGYSKSAIGLLWALGVVVEVLLFRFQKRVFDRWSALGLLAFSLAVAALRFALTGASAGWLPLLVIGQLMHAITFGLHHSAVMRVLHLWFDARQQGRAQALYITIAYGLGGSLGGLAVSALWSRVSPAAAFHGAALAALVGLGLTLWCRHLARARGLPA